MTNIDSQVGVQKILMEWVPHYPPEVTDWDIIRAAMLFANAPLPVMSRSNYLGVWTPQ